MAERGELTAHFPLSLVVVAQPLPREQRVRCRVQVDQFQRGGWGKPFGRSLACRDEPRPASSDHTASSASKSSESQAKTASSAPGGAGAEEDATATKPTSGEAKVHFGGEGRRRGGVERRRATGRDD